MRVIFFTKCGQSAAGYRTRLAQFLPELQSQGVECVVSNLEDGKVERQSWLKRIGEFDLAVVYHELFPHVPPALESGFLTIPYVFDFDDAIQVRETPFTRDKTATLIAGARAVIAGSGELESFARRFNRNVRLIPTVVDVDRYASAERARRRKNAPFTIGWIGTPQTTEYLPLVAEPLRRLSAARGARLLTIGAGPVDLPGVRHESRQWKEKSELADLSEADVGIMPLKDDEWSRGKCGFKLVQYHAMGIPSVASAIGANRQIVEDGVTGLLVTGPDQWVEALTRLADDPELRARMGARAFERAKALYSLEYAAPLFVQTIFEAAGRQTRRQASRI